MARPEKPIDWKLVDNLIQCGSPGTEIAGSVGVHEHTFYDRVLKEKGISFTDYAAELYSRGKGRIRARQYQKAMEGNVNLLLWLGKVLLKQKEPEDEESKPTVPNEDFLKLQDDYLKLKYEMDQLKNALQPETTTILQRSDSPI